MVTFSQLFLHCLMNWNTPMAAKMRATTKATPLQDTKMNTPSEIKVYSAKAKDSGKKSAPKPSSDFQTKSLGAKQGSVSKRASVAKKNASGTKVNKYV